LKTHEIALRYSKAIFNLSANKQQLNSWLYDLEAVVDLLKRHPKIKQYFDAPQIGLETKLEVLKKGIGAALDSQLLNYLQILLQRKWFIYLPEIVAEYRRKVFKELGILEGQLITAEILKPPIRDNLHAALEKLYQGKLDFKDEVDPKIIGGCIVIIGNRRIDFSIRGKLEQLKLALESPKTMIQAHDRPN